MIHHFLYCVHKKNCFKCWRIERLSHHVMKILCFLYSCKILFFNEFSSLDPRCHVQLWARRLLLQTAVLFEGTHGVPAAPEFQFQLNKCQAAENSPLTTKSTFEFSFYQSGLRSKPYCLNNMKSSTVVLIGIDTNMISTVVTTTSISFIPLGSSATTILVISITVARSSSFCAQIFSVCYWSIPKSSFSSIKPSNFSCSGFFWKTSEQRHNYLSWQPKDHTPALVALVHPPVL